MATFLEPFNGTSAKLLILTDKLSAGDYTKSVSTDETTYCTDTAMVRYGVAYSMITAASCVLHFFPEPVYDPLVRTEWLSCLTSFMGPHRATCGWGGYSFRRFLYNRDNVKYYGGANRGS